MFPHLHAGGTGFVGLVPMGMWGRADGVFTGEKVSGALAHPIMQSRVWSWMSAENTRGEGGDDLAYVRAIPRCITLVTSLG